MFLKLNRIAQNNTHFVNYFRKTFGKNLADMLEVKKNTVLAFDLADEDDDEFNMSRQQSAVDHQQ